MYYKSNLCGRATLPRGWEKILNNARNAGRTGLGGANFGFVELSMRVYCIWWFCCCSMKLGHETNVAVYI